MWPVIICALFLMCIGCNKSDTPAGAAAPLTPTAGTFVFKAVACYQPLYAGITNSAVVTNAYSETITFTGSTYSRTSTDGTCVVTEEGTATLPTTVSMVLSGRVVKSATGGSCSQARSISGSAVTPVSMSTTFSAGDVLTDLSVPVYASGAFGLASSYSDGTTGGSCLLIFNP